MQNSKPKSKPTTKECDCVACRLQSVIISELAPEDREVFTLNAVAALEALAPTIGMFLAGIEYREAEAYWRELLNVRARCMLPDGMEYGQDFKGRA